MATEMAGVGGAGGQGHVSLRSIVPVECKRRTSGPDCLSAASFWAARRAFYRHLTAWRVASATCFIRAGFLNSIQLESLAASHSAFSFSVQSENASKVLDQPIGRCLPDVLFQFVQHFHHAFNPMSG